MLRAALKLRPWRLADVVVAAAKACGRVLQSMGEFRGKQRFAVTLGGFFAQVAVRDLQAAPIGGVLLAVPAWDRVARIMWAGSYEPELTRWFSRVVRPGWVVLDVGAHVGWFTTLCSKLVGDYGLVEAFEPDPGNLNYLRKNTRGLANVRIWPLAVSGTVGTATFYRSPRASESGWGSLLPDSEPREAIEVATTTIDEHVASHALDRVDLIKLDVEGAEPRCLRGARRTLRTLRPLMVLEANPVCLAREGYTLADLRETLERERYCVGRLSPHHVEDGGTLVGVPRERDEILHELGSTIEW